MSESPHPASVSLSIEVPVIDHAHDPVHAQTPPADPEALAASWLPGPDEDRMLMTLSTVTAEGTPRARTVMLSDVEGSVFSFHTDANSRKVADITANPAVALTILWPGFTRQLVVEGVAVAMSADRAATAYARRSPYLRQLAWLNTAEFAALPREERERSWATFAKTHPDPQPPRDWVGFDVTAHRWLFWTSHPGAASRRIQYTRGDDGWVATPLPG